MYSSDNNASHTNSCLSENSYQNSTKGKHPLTNRNRKSYAWNPRHARYARKRSSGVGRVIFALCLILFVLIVFTAIVGLKTYHEVWQVRDYEKQAVQSLSPLRSQLSKAASGSTDASNLLSNSGNAKYNLEQTLKSVQNATSSANTITHRWNWTLLSHVPKIGQDITIARGLTQAGDDLTRTTLPQYLSVYKSISGLHLGNSSGTGLDLSPISRLQPSLIKANSSLHQISRNLTALPQGRITKVRQIRSRVISTLTPLSQRSQALTDGVNFLVKLVGSKTISTYVIENATPAEVRSSGGLVGSLGALRLGQNRIEAQDFHSNDEILRGQGAGSSSGVKAVSDTSTAWRIFNTPDFYYQLDMRDAGVDPDFGNTARNLINVWNTSSYGKAQPATGLLQTDPRFVQALIAATGPVKLPTGTTLTGSNTAEFLQNTIYRQIPNNPALQNAYFGIATVTAIRNVSHNLTSATLFSLVKQLPSLISNRDVCMYSSDPSIESTLRSMGLTPAPQSSAEHPTLGFYLNSRHASKMDWYGQRDISVQQTSGPQTTGTHGIRTYKVTLKLINTLHANEVRSLPSYITAGDGLLYDQLLLYPPQGGSITDLSGNRLSQNPTDYTWNGKKLFSMRTQLQPGQTLTLTMTVTTSPDATQGLSIDQSSRCK
jgi:hypothetical protein